MFTHTHHPLHADLEHGACTEQEPEQRSCVHVCFLATRSACRRERLGAAHQDVSAQVSLFCACLVCFLRILICLCVVCIFPGKHPVFHSPSQTHTHTSFVLPSIHSFSGGTLEHPGFLKYSCDLRTNIRFLSPARVLLPPGEACDNSNSSSSNSTKDDNRSVSCRPNEVGELMHAVLGGRPLLTMGFDDMEVRVCFLKCELDLEGQSA